MNEPGAVLQSDGSGTAGSLPRPPKRRAVTANRTLRRCLAAGGLLLLAAGLTACGSPPRSSRGTDAGPNASPSTSRQYAGHVPWASAVVGADGRTVHLLADWDRTDAFICDSPDERLQLEQTATRVVITIRAYARPLPHDVLCGGVGHALQPHLVHLAAPLGARSLVDGGFQERRAVLADSSVPTSDAVPGGYTAQPLTWDAPSTADRTATRRWQKVAPDATRMPVLLQLTVGLPTTYSGFAASAGRAVGTATIHGAHATISRSESGGQIVDTIRWTTSAGRQTTLTAIGSTDDHLTAARILAFARSLEPADASGANG